ncbi:MAG: D-alanyl-D-alanine carboxypeptidase family protein [Pseudomonadota bacterium]|nr:D-alanyl-D-alanine carboxypeptidase family protein [Pseudomonadota bacterium]
MSALRPRVLLNFAELELWPAWLLRARSNAVARQLAGTAWLVRRKTDGLYLACLDAQGQTRPIPPLTPGFRQKITLPPLRKALQRIVRPPQPLPFHALEKRLAQLGLDADNYARASGLERMAEPDWLQLAGFDRYRRPLWLAPASARAWQRMQAAARQDGITLEAVSGYRSHDYQLGIFQRKRACGLAVDAILQVNAAPGFSEHHTGRALDISTPGEPAAEESFEHTPAFAWLCDNAAQFDFHLSYPRNNPHGICYEPWHWCHAPITPHHEHNIALPH